jgi:8-oxo-dGTP pyrophosphatase MutT (NUDIX family)
LSAEPRDRVSGKVSQLSTRTIVSAGGVVYRKVEDRIFFVLVGRRRGNYWCLPKGRIEENETEVDAARREVFEETGIPQVDLGEKIGTISYEFYRRSTDSQYEKFVHFYLMKSKVATLHVGTEFDRAMWFPARDALNMVSHRKEKEIVSKALKMLGLQ